MADPLQLVPQAERAKTINTERMLRHLDWFRQRVERGEIDQIAIVATYVDGGESTSSVELVGKRLYLYGAVHVLALRLEADFLDFVPHIEPGI